MNTDQLLDQYAYLVSALLTHTAIDHTRTELALLDFRSRHETSQPSGFGRNEKAWEILDLLLCAQSVEDCEMHP